MAYTSYTTSPSVLMPGSSFTHNVAVSDPNATADSNGLKWVHAGTLLGGDSDFLNVADPHSSVLLHPVTDASQAQAILMNDVVLDVNGNGNGSGIVGGEITTKFMKDDIKKVYTADVIKGLKATLPNVIVISR